MAARPGYVFFGSVQWDAPWLTDQNLASSLSRRGDVLYVEPAITPMTPLRYGIRSDTAAELRTLALRQLRQEGTLRIFRPVALPLRTHPRSQAASAPLLRRQIRRAVAEAGIRHPVAIAARSMLDVAGAVDERALVYLVKDWIASGGDLLGRDPARLAQEREAMCAAADLVCSTSPRLSSSLEAHGVENMLLPHGFHSELAPLYDYAEAPPEYRDLPRPLLGYTGRIDARLAFDALIALSERQSEGSIVLVGPVSPRLDRRELGALSKRPNVHLLGERQRAELPRYIAALDCCLLPYRDTDWLAHGSPLKLWDYLYAGPPIAASGCHALEDFPAPLVFFSRDPAALPETADAALAAGADGAVARRSLALANTWDTRAAELEERLLALDPRVRYWRSRAPMSGAPTRGRPR